MILPNKPPVDAGGEGAKRDVAAGAEPNIEPVGLGAEPNKEPEALGALLNREPASFGATFLSGADFLAGLTGRTGRFDLGLGAGLAGLALAFLAAFFGVLNGLATAGLEIVALFLGLRKSLAYSRVSSIDLVRLRVPEIGFLLTFLPILVN